LLVESVINRQFGGPSETKEIISAITLKRGLKRLEKNLRHKILRSDLRKDFYNKKQS
jgi:hypothetical protein